ncbi:hypothetical protein BDZ97DRAFT_1366922 [Flammula alnicola]|nr:hypothetical protein BDZ97DRAFT_1366922 [Flammula alnicola]
MISVTQKSRIVQLLVGSLHAGSTMSASTSPAGRHHWTLTKSPSTKWTISIAKAGIHATLKAWTSILGRHCGRICRRLPIMSRFYPFFVFRYECDPLILRPIRQRSSVPRLSIWTLGWRHCRDNFACRTSTVSLKMTPEVAGVLVEKYEILRQNDAIGQRKIHTGSLRPSLEPCTSEIYTRLFPRGIHPAATVYYPCRTRRC